MKLFVIYKQKTDNLRTLYAILCRAVICLIRNVNNLPHTQGTLDKGKILYYFTISISTP